LFQDLSFTKEKTMSFKKVALAALVTIPTSQAFGAEVSGNVALTSDYKFRGISQSDSAPLFKAVLISLSTMAPTLALGVQQ
jgi:uncharacterized protein (TIGR02001 family)